VELTGPAGRLEARLRDAPATADPPAAVVLCHPNPVQGGSMDNKTLYRIARRLPLEVGVPALRFNFRGTGHSEGRHEFGANEAADVTAALDWLERRYPRSLLLVVGYSFGAVVGLRAGQDDERVTHLIALGLPLEGSWDLGSVAATTSPASSSTARTTNSAMRDV
jgi:alpha/beta superfamily hydrolase